MMELDDVYTLVLINDAHSTQKSDIAKEIIKRNMTDHNIEYRTKDMVKVKCVNNLLLKDDILTQTERKGNHIIMDEFIVENSDGVRFVIGNHCIATLVEYGKIENIDRELFDTIVDLIKLQNVCFICEHRCKKIAHKKCIQGLTKREISFEKDQIKRKCRISNELSIHIIYNQLRSLFKGCNVVQNIKTLNTVRAKQSIHKMYTDHQLLVDNTHKLLSLPNNCIVKSITQQRRLPSIKQISILEKIIQDYHRIKHIDDSLEYTHDLDENGYLVYRNKNGDVVSRSYNIISSNVKAKYERYGYVY